MSQLGHERPKRVLPTESGLPQTADIRRRGGAGLLCAITGREQVQQITCVAARLFDHLVHGGE